MAAESWWNLPPAGVPASVPPPMPTRRPRGTWQEEKARRDAERPPAPPTPPPGVDGLPHGCRRTRAEVELLRGDAEAELLLGDWGDSPQALIDGTRLTDINGERPDEIARGVIECCRWLLGERTTGPLVGLDYGTPPQPLAVATETHQAYTVAAMTVDDWREIGLDYGQGVYFTLMWVQSTDADADPPKRPMKRPQS